MRLSCLLYVGASILLLPAAVSAEIQISTGHSAAGSGFTFESVPAPVTNDAANNARFSLIDGTTDRNGGSLAVLHDGRVPSEEDQPSENFFFRAGTDGGLIQIDLGRALPVKRIGTYSWHTNTRAPQVYVLYASDGIAPGFDRAPRRGIDPTACGWKQIASVDTRTQSGDGGGQHGVAITDHSGVIGTYRYLLFDISQTEGRDPFGNTFYSEIDVIDAEGPAPAFIKSGESQPIVISFEAEGGIFRFTIDVTRAPDMAEWSEDRLKPVVQEWYARLVGMLPSEGYQAPAEIRLRFREDMGGVPASAGGATINLNASWFRRERDREALGAVVHEMVHVVQGYSRRGTPTPGWLVEGIADYIRWFLYEPEKKGAEITKRSLPTAKFDSSYRITGNFLDWVTRRYDEEIVPKLNAAARNGLYNEQLWREWTGKTLQELGAEWKEHHAERLGLSETATGSQTQ